MAGRGRKRGPQEEAQEKKKRNVRTTFYVIGAGIALSTAVVLLHLLVAVLILDVLACTLPLRIYLPDMEMMSLLWAASPCSPFFMKLT